MSAEGQNPNCIRRRRLRPASTLTPPSRGIPRRKRDPRQTLATSHIDGTRDLHGPSISHWWQRGGTAPLPCWTPAAGLVPAAHGGGQQFTPLQSAAVPVSGAAWATGAGGAWVAAGTSSARLMAQMELTRLRGHSDLGHRARGGSVGGASVEVSGGVPGVRGGDGPGDREADRAGGSGSGGG